MNKIRDFFHNNKYVVHKMLVVLCLYVIISILFAFFIGHLLSLAASGIAKIGVVENATLAAQIIVGVLVFLFAFFFSRFVYRYEPVQRDRLLFARTGRWLALFSIAIIITGISYIIVLAQILALKPEMIYSASDYESNHLFWSILSQFADPGNLPQAHGVSGKIVAFISALAGIVCLSGLVVTLFVNIINRRTQKWRQGHTHYTYGFSNYVVIIGINEQTVEIVKTSLKRSDVDYVLIQTKKDVEKERDKLELRLSRSDEKRVVFYSGERTLYEDIKELHLERAKEVYILGEDMHYDDEQDHDSYNMTCLELISKYCGESKSQRQEKLNCHVNFEYQSTYTIFKYTHLYRSLNQNVEFIPFNVHEIWAKKVLVDNYAISQDIGSGTFAIQRYFPLDCYRDEQTKEYVYGITSESDKSVHLFIVGMNQMGVALAMQAALLIHLPNFYTKRCRTTISFIDEEAVKEGEFLKGRFAALFSLCRNRTIVCESGKDIKSWDDELSDEDSLDRIDPMINGRYSYLGDNFMDIQWEFIEGNVASAEVRKYMEMTASDSKKTCTIAICLNNPQQAIATALYLPEKVLKRVLQVLVYQQHSFDLINHVAHGESEWKRYEKLKPFGMLENCYDGNMFDNTLAKLAVKLYKEKTLQYGSIDFVIDYINRLWSEEGIVNKLSNINLVDSFALKLRSVGLNRLSSREEVLRITNDDEAKRILSYSEHSRWLTERLTMGYRPLDKEEFDYFLNPEISDASKMSKKEFYKSKKRAHLDICSVGLLKKVDPNAQNDARVIKNLVNMKFYKIEAEILCRLAIRSQSEPSLQTERTRVTYEFINEMQEINVGQKKFNDFWIGKYPVTQRLWKLIMGGKTQNGDDYPMVNVSKSDIDDYILILNDITGLYFHLPNLQEWKIAAGNKIKRKEIDYYAWHSGNIRGKKCLQRVGKKKCNVYGLYDMLGNVWEWTCSKPDKSKSTYYFCGGSWNFGKKECNVFSKTDDQSWLRNWVPDFKSSDLGFRLVLSHVFNKDSSLKLRPETDKYKILREILKNMVIVEGGNGIDTFCMSSTPVTQQQWMAFMGQQSNKSRHKGYDLPVENVSYLDAVKFVAELNKFYLQDTVLKLDLFGIFELPTEPQWELAAYGGAKVEERTKYSGSNEPDEVAWHSGITSTTHPVKKKKPNQIDLYDMCGNVWEWCRNISDDRVEGIQVLRGGSWRFSAQECLITVEKRELTLWPEDYKADHVGFRLVLTLTPKGRDLFCRKDDSEPRNYKVIQFKLSEHKK